MSLKQRPEERDVLIANRIADLLHRPVVAFQEPFGCGDPQLLQVVQRTVSGGFLEAANEIPEAHAHPLCWYLEGKSPVKILMQPLL